MFTKTEKGYLILTLGFLAAGSGIKAYRHAAIKLGPFKEAASPLAEAASHTTGAPSLTAELNSPIQTTASPDFPASESTLTGAAAGPDSLSGSASQGQVLSSADSGGGSLQGFGEPDTARPGSVKAAEAPELHRTAGSGAAKAGFTGKVDLNRADASELTRVKGIGAKTAQAIVDYRRAHGPYRNFRDLLKIKGIGEKKLEKLMPNLIL